MTQQATKLEPRFINRKQLRIAGVSVHYAEQNAEAFAKQWEDFAPSIPAFPGRSSSDALGVVTGSFGGVDGFEYMTGVEVSSFDNVPPKYRRLTIPAQRYAIFMHNGHVSQIRDTVYAIKKEWLPKLMVPGRSDTSKEASDLPDFFERYGKDFDPKTGTGKVEIWVPLKR
jgi:AraC family transcriptional regulator